jgi:hypothetical protein
MRTRKFSIHEENHGKFPYTKTRQICKHERNHGKFLQACVKETTATTATFSLMNANTASFLANVPTVIFYKCEHAFYENNWTFLVMNVCTAISFPSIMRRRKYFILEPLSI